MEQRRNAGKQKTGDPRENPPTGGTYRQDSRVRNSREPSTPGIEPGSPIVYIPPHSEVNEGATVAERVARSPPTKANRVQSPAGSPDFRKWESCRKMTLVGGFSQGSPVSPIPPASGAAPCSLQSLSSALKNSLLSAAQISSLTGKLTPKAEIRYIYRLLFQMRGLSKELTLPRKPILHTCCCAMCFGKRIPLDDSRKLTRPTGRGRYDWSRGKKGAGRFRDRKRGPARVTNTASSITYDTDKVKPCPAAREQKCPAGFEFLCRFSERFNHLPAMFLHWLMAQRVDIVTPHLAVWHSLLVSLQVCHWLRVVQGVSNKLRSNCKANFSVHRGVFCLLAILPHRGHHISFPIGRVVISKTSERRTPIMRLATQLASWGGGGPSQSGKHSQHAVANERTRHRPHQTNYHFARRVLIYSEIRTRGFGQASRNYHSPASVADRRTASRVQPLESPRGTKALADAAVGFDASADSHVRLHPPTKPRLACPKSPYLEYNYPVIVGDYGEALSTVGAAGVEPGPRTGGPRSSRPSGRAFGVWHKMAGIATIFPVSHNTAVPTSYSSPPPPRICFSKQQDRLTEVVLRFDLACLLPSLAAGSSSIMLYFNIVSTQP
ncbi:hypothetical protein PR048_026123 [Dryococelus australis]|uniref:Uncharacterized protein n=1 Tax=Dryococelus australis TaxID=614101 RepID=A0ABQ9GKI7_9NEOP|nr:hypothetical protein PR048_026123 [Dryococelus australis]